MAGDAFRVLVLALVLEGLQRMRVPGPGVDSGSPRGGRGRRPESRRRASLQVLQPLGAGTGKGLPRRRLIGIVDVSQGPIAAADSASSQVTDLTLRSKNPPTPAGLHPGGSGPGWIAHHGFDEWLVRQC